MTKEKQIEELSKDIFEHCNAGLFEDEAEQIARFVIEEQSYRKATIVAELEEKLADVTANWQKIHDAYTADCIEHYKKGRSEVAREIFEEIEKQLNEFDGSWANTVINTQYLIAELKKKYTEEGK